VEEFSKKSDFYFLLQGCPVGLEIIRLSVMNILAAFLAKDLIIRRMHDMVSELVDCHCGRVRYDLTRRIQTTAKWFECSLNKKVDLTLNGIREALSRGLALKKRRLAEVGRALS